MTKRLFSLCLMLTAASVSIRAADIGAVFEYASGVWYNLNGQRVENPSKGIYIRNGKVVVVGKGIYSKHF